MKTTEITKIIVGGSEYSKMYFGSSLAWEKESTIEPEYMYLKIAGMDNLVEGDYYIVSAGNGPGYSGGPYNDEDLYALEYDSSSSYVHWSAYTKSANQLWHITKSSYNQFYIQNVSNGKYIGPADGTAGSNYGKVITFTDSPLTTYVNITSFNAQKYGLSANGYEYGTNECMISLYGSHSGSRNSYGTISKTSGDLKNWGTYNDLSTYKMNCFFLVKRKQLETIEAGDNVIYYTTTDDAELYDINTNYNSANYNNFGAELVSNVYYNGLGTLQFDNPVTRMVVGMEERHTFRFCRNLLTISIPATVENISWSALAGTGSLQSITVAEGNPRYRSSNGFLIDKTNDTIIHGLYGKTIPPDAYGLGPYCYNGYDSGTTENSIDIPSTIRFIDEGVFYGWDSLRTIIFHGEGPAVSGSVFSGATSGVTVYYPEEYAGSYGDIISYATNMGWTCTPY